MKTAIGTAASIGGVKPDQRRFHLIVHLIFILLCVVVTVPFIVILMASFTNEVALYRDGYGLWTKHFSLDAYRVAFANSGQLVQSYTVTVLTTVAGTFLGLWLMTTLGYVLSRGDYKYRNLLSFCVFFTVLFRGGLVPTYILVTKWLGMQNTIFALFVPALVNPFYVLIVKGFLKSIPSALYECAKLDGAGELRIFMRIVIPLSTPAIATVGLLMSLQFWNDWFSSLLYTDDSQLQTLQALLYRMLSNMQFLSVIQPAGLDSSMLPQASFRMAMCVLAVGPLLLVFPFFQRFFARGLTVGSIKG